jgi:hypothetical protein
MLPFVISALSWLIGSPLMALEHLACAISDQPFAINGS